MVFSKNGYTLYKRAVVLKSGYNHTIYFFSKKTPNSGTPTDIPNGYELGINDKSGMPYLRYSGGRISKWQTIKKKK